MTFLSLFAGVGGFDLGLERAGHTCVGQVEIDPYCQRVLAKHWPDVPKHDDVRTFHGSEFGPFDLLVGGYPCQPFSVAGQRKGEDDERHLWPEVHRIIRNVRPRYALLENVPGHLALGFGRVLGDLAESGYDAEWDCIPAAAVGAPHLRDRLFIIAYPNRDSLRQQPEPQPRREAAPQPPADGTHRTMANPARELLHGAGASRALRRTESANRSGALADANQQRLREAGRPQEISEVSRRCSADRGWPGWATEPNVGRVAHGVPARVERLRALGNAVVPQVAEYLGTLLANIEREAVAA